MYLIYNKRSIYRVKYIFSGHIYIYIYMTSLMPGLVHKDNAFTFYLLKPWCRFLLEKLNSLQIVKKFPALYGTRRFIIALTNVRQLFLSRDSPIQPTYPHPIPWRSILILSTHLRLGIPSGLFPSGFPTKILYTPLLTHTRHTPSQSHSSRFYHSHNIG